MDDGRGRETRSDDLRHASDFSCAATRTGAADGILFSSSSDAGTAGECGSGSAARAIASLCRGGRGRKLLMAVVCADDRGGAGCAFACDESGGGAAPAFGGGGVGG